MSDKPKKTLENDEIVTERGMGRRSAIGVIGATVVGAAAATIGIAAVQPNKLSRSRSISSSRPFSVRV